MRDDEISGPRPSSFNLGQPVDTMSVEELRETIDRLKAEIDRLEAAVRAKTSHLAAADALFSKK